MRKISFGLDLDKKLQRAMLQNDEKLVRLNQVAEQEIAIEDNAPSQGYPLFSIESGEITEKLRMLTYTCYISSSTKFLIFKEK